MSRRKWRELSVERGLPIGAQNESKKRFEEEKRREYEQFKKDKVEYVRNLILTFVLFSLTKFFLISI